MVFYDNTTEVAGRVAGNIEVCSNWKAGKVNSNTMFVVIEPHSKPIGCLAYINGFRAPSAIQHINYIRSIAASSDGEKSGFVTEFN